MKEVTVKRSLWTGEDGYLWGEDKDHPNENGLFCSGTGRMCCLGFVCEKAGISKHEMEGNGMPEDLFSFLRKGDVLDVWGLVEDSGEEVTNSDLSCRAAAINDDREIAQKQKEEMLTALFAEHEIKLTFED